jgi:type IV secretion/conjugal transfer VirB4 family ATPase
MLAAFSPKPRGLSDLVSYAALVDEGVCLLKDGGFLTAWTYTGPDLESASHEELAVLSSQVNAALARLGNGWMLHVDAIRRPSVGYPEGGAFPDQTTRLIDEERRERYTAEGTHFESAYYLSLTYRPPAEIETRVSALFLEGDGQRHQGWGQILDIFRNAATDAEDALSARLTLTRLDSPALLTYLHTCITGLRHPVRVPAIPMYLDAVVATQDLVGGFRPRIGDRHLRVIAIMGFPMDSVPEILGFLSRLPVEYRWSTRFIFLDPASAERALRVYRRNWFQKRHGLLGLLKESFNFGSVTFTNKDALAMAQDADDAVGEASANMVRFGYLTCNVLLFDPDLERIDGTAREVVKHLQHHGFGARVEEVNALEAYLGSLPGHGYQNVRKPLLHTLNLADLLPLTSIWPGLERHPCPLYPPGSPSLCYTATAGATPFRLNLHVSDVGHTLILGPTGSGKSTLVGLLIAQFFRYPDAQVFLFDKDYSAYVLAHACGAEYYDIAGDAERGLAFTPLAAIDRDHERRWAQEWIEVLLDLQGITPTPAQRAALWRALELLAESPSRTMTDFVHTLQDQGLRDALAHYTLTGPVGHLLDAQSENLGRSRLQVFEMSHLMALGQKHLVPTLLYLFHRVEERLEAGAPALLVVEEAWVTALHSLFGAAVESWLRTLRKKNAAVVFVSQSVADVVNSPRRDVILESCPTKVLLPNPEAESDHVRRLYEGIGLNRRQTQILATALPKRHYYVMSPLGRRLVSLGLGPVALSFVGIAGREAIVQANDQMAAHGRLWPAAWLRARGLEPAAEAWTRYFEEAAGTSMREVATP